MTNTVEPARHASMGARWAATLAAAAALTLACALPFVDFYAANLDRIASAGRLYNYFGITLLIALAAVAVGKLIGRRVPLSRYLLVAAVGVYVVFLYRYFGNLAQAYFAEPPRVYLALVAWVLVFAAVLGAAWTYTRGSTAAWTLLALFSLFNASPAIGILLHETPAVASEDFRVPSADPVAAARPLNIYWVVLDGYPRADVLKSQFGFDNSAFLAALRAKDFTVVDKAYAAFPVTENSISSTLMLDYLLTPGSTDLPTAGAMYPIIRGKNRVVETLSKHGYRYVHYENAYSYGHMCDEDQPICISGNKGFDEIDIKLIGNTPLLDLYLLKEGVTASSLWKNAEADRKDPFGWGGVDALTAKLAEIQETPSPFFLYAHIIAPHPPIRFDRRCSHRPARPELENWAASERGAFIEQLECTNTQALALLDQIIANDPQAIVIVQSDHGSAFRQQFDKPMDKWDSDDLRERFGALDAIRLPEACRAPLSSDLSLTNTFPVVLGCVTGAPVELLPQRHFVTGYADSPDYTLSYEVPALP